LARIALINPSLEMEDVRGVVPVTDPAHTLPPLGLLMIAAALRNNKHDVYVIDGPGERIPAGNGQYRLLTNSEIAERVCKRGADFVGITSTIISLSSCQDLAHKLRSYFNKDLVIVYGGHQISAVFSVKDKTNKRIGGGYYSNGLKEMEPKRQQNILDRFDGMDFGIIGEGEQPFLDLIKAVEYGKDPRIIPGLVWNIKSNSSPLLSQIKPVKIGCGYFVTPLGKPSRDLDLLNGSNKPLTPAYDLLVNPTVNYSPSEITYRNKPSISVITSRGCPQHCKFCDMSTHGHTLRIHSPEYTVKLLLWLEKKWGYRDFYITDDQGTAHPRFLDGLCDELEKCGRGGGYENGGYNLSVIGRVHPIFPDQLKRLAKNGGHQIAFGIESASPAILNFFDKRTDPEKIRNGVRIAHDAGMEVKGLFMAGSPTETTKTLAETQVFIDELELEYVSNSALTPIPGSELYELAMRNLRSYYYKGISYIGNDLGIWIADPDDWDKFTLWESIWTPKSLTDELGSPYRAKEYIENIVRRKGLKAANKKLNHSEMDWGYSGALQEGAV